MAISPTCARCSHPLTEEGAILFAPPRANLAKKLHLCVTCYKRVCEVLAEMGNAIPMTYQLRLHDLQRAADAMGTEMSQPTS